MAERRSVRSHADDDEAADGHRRRPSGGRNSEESADTSADTEDTETRSRSARRDRDGGLAAAKAAQLGLRQIAELTGKKPESVTGVRRAEDGWVVGVEVVEDRRIPSSTDILAIYEAEFDTSGELVSYRRVKRYARGRGDSGDS